MSRRAVVNKAYTDDQGGGHRVHLCILGSPFKTCSSQIEQISKYCAMCINHRNCIAR